MDGSKKNVAPLPGRPERYAGRILGRLQVAEMPAGDRYHCVPMLGHPLAGECVGLECKETKELAEEARARARELQRTLERLEEAMTAVCASFEDDMPTACRGYLEPEW